MRGSFKGGRLALAVAGLFFSCAGAGFAQDAPPADPSGLFIKPVVLDSEESDGATLGLEFRLKGSWKGGLLDDDDSNTGDTIDTEVGLGAIDLNYKARGTIATEAERNPEDFLDFQAGLDFERSVTAGSVKGGGFVKFETDQSFDNNQFVYGLGATAARRGFLGPNNAVAVDLDFGRVEPGDDKERKTALGTTTLESYNRLDLEAVFLFRTGIAMAPELEFNYRYYREFDPPVLVEAAGLDTHELSTVRLGLTGDLFVAYSSGKLPFDKTKDQIFKIGFSRKLQ
jgi:hypothetical protein